MRAHLLKWWNDLRSSYWFLPAVMTVVALLTAPLLLWIDHRFGNQLGNWTAGMASNQPEGARALLSTLAGSMITVAGLTFSMTLLAVSHASTQFGPRLLSNFMRNRGNQFVLGVYVATFLYCLVILQAVRTSDDSVSPPGQAFVPHVSVMVALLLAIANVGVLIYYIHHVADSLRLSSIVATVGHALHRPADQLFPQPVFQPAEEAIEKQTDTSAELREALQRQPRIVHAERAGFLQTLDLAGLLEVASEHDLVIELLSKPGDFLPQGAPLLRAAPGDRVDDALANKLANYHAKGIHRTPTQNAVFLADQLAEVAMRGVSPGVNDPHTAIDCLHWLTSFLNQLRDRPDPSGQLYDDQGIVRLIAPRVTYNLFCDVIYRQLIPYVGRDENASRAMLEGLNWLIGEERSNERILRLRQQANHLFEAIEAANWPSTSRQAIEQLRPT